jgi:hypothetical protein
LLQQVATINNIITVSRPCSSDYRISLVSVAAYIHNITSTKNTETTRNVPTGRMKFNLEQVMKAQRGSRVIALLFL